MVEETDDYVYVYNQGVERKIARNRVLNIVYNTGTAEVDDSQAAAAADDAQEAEPEAAQAPTAAPPTVEDSDREEYYAGICQTYNVTDYDVLLVERRGVPVEEVPVVFFLANEAHVAPALVANLRLGGLSWMDVVLRLNLSPAVFWLSVPQAELLPPYDHVFAPFYRLPRRRWHTIVMPDLDIVNCVNLHLAVRHWGVRPVEVIRLRHNGLFFPGIWLDFGRRHPELRPRHSSVHFGVIHSRVQPAPVVREHREGVRHDGARREGVRRDGVRRDGEHREKSQPKRQRLGGNAAAEGAPGLKALKGQMQGDGPSQGGHDGGGQSPAGPGGHRGGRD